MNRPLPRRRPVRTTVLAALALAASLSLTACSEGPDEDERAAAAALVEQGSAQLGAGEDDRAEETLERALRLDPAQALAHYNLGVIDQRANRAEAALVHYDAALELDDDHGPTLYNRSMLLEKVDLDRAVAGYREAIEAQPRNAAAYMRLGFALNHLGRTAEAAPMLAKGIELDPEMEKVEAPSYE